ncbi:MAG: hypothetical protein ACRD4Q_07455 [Candidatus Acidiferrales bacterium]
MTGDYPNGYPLGHSCLGSTCGLVNPSPLSSSRLDAPLTDQQIAVAEERASREGYVHRVFYGLDQFLASLLDVENDQTISSATEIAAHKKVWYTAFAKALNDGLDLIQRSHGQKAQAGDLARAEEVIATDTAALKSEQARSSK